MITDLMKKPTPLPPTETHDSAVSRAGVLIIPSTALQEHLGWDKNTTAIDEETVFPETD